MEPRYLRRILVQGNYAVVTKVFPALIAPGANSARLAQFIKRVKRCEFKLLEIELLPRLLFLVSLLTLALRFEALLDLLLILATFDLILFTLHF